MAYLSFSDFTHTLEEAGELRRIDTPLSTDQILVEHPRQPDDQALLFTQVAGADVPLLLHPFASARRMALALEVADLDQLTTKMDALLAFRPEDGRSPMTQAATLLNLLRTVSATNRVKQAPCQHLIQEADADLTRLPALPLSPGEDGRFLTLAQLITGHTDSGRQTAVLCHAQVQDRKTALLTFPFDTPRPEASGPLPAAIVLGGDPAAIWAAGMPLPPAIDPYWLAGWLRGRPLTFVSGHSQPLDVPAGVDVVIEGVFIGDRSGSYFQVTAVTRRRRPLCPLILPGPAPTDFDWMAKAGERLFLPLLRLLLPEIIDLNIAATDSRPHLTIASVKRPFPGLAQQVMHGLWGLRPFAASRVIVIVDAVVDVHDLAAVRRQVQARVDWRQDVLPATGPIPGGSGGESWFNRIGIDATIGPKLRTAEQPDSIQSHSRQIWREWGLGAGD